MITKDGRVRYASLVVASVAILAVPALSNLIVNAVLRVRYQGDCVVADVENFGEVRRPL